MTAAILVVMRTGNRSSDFASQIGAKDILHYPGYAGVYFYPEALEQVNRTRTHPASYHHMSLLIPDKLGNLSRYMVAGIRVFDDTHFFNFIFFKIHKRIKRTPAEMSAHR